MEKVEKFIAKEKGHKRLICEELRRLILENIPNVKEEIKWNCPFYSYKGILCFINPRKDCVDLGFYQGHLLSNENGILDTDGKTVRHIKYVTIDDIDEYKLLEVINEAVLINEELQKKQKNNDQTQ